MEVTETLALVSTLAGSLKTIKSACDNIDPGLLPNNRKKLKDLQKEVKQLEAKIQQGFPELASLTRNYAEVSAMVRVAKALSDKNCELLGFLKAEESVRDFLSRIPGQMEDECTRIEKKLKDLPEINSGESGELKTHLANIREKIGLVRNVNPNHNASTEQIFDSKDKTRDYTGEISSYYSKIDTVLSSLLNRILVNLGQIKV